MKINVYSFSKKLSVNTVKDKIAVVIDVFRATSVITTALAHGAKSILVASNIRKALFIYEKLDKKNVCLAGEKNMHKIKNFHYGNSPRFYTNETIRNKKIILTTTNGTKAINFCVKAKETYIVSLLNVFHLASELAKKESAIAILCSGSKGEFAIEDAFCAGMLIQTLSSMKKLEIDDMGYLMQKIYKMYEKNPEELLKNSSSYKILSANGYKDDIDFCLQKNIYSIAPKYDGQKIVI